MKRYLSIFLSLVLVLTLIPFSVSASSFNSNGDTYKYDITPFFAQTLYENLEGSLIVPYASFGFKSTFQYIDILFSTDSSTFKLETSLAVLNIEKIQGNLYRAYGRLYDNLRNEVYFTFKDYDIGSYLEILKVEVTPVDYIIENVPITCRITGKHEYRTDGDGVLHVQSIDYTTVLTSNNECLTPLLDNVLSSNGAASVFLTCNLSFNWKRFDYLELYIHNAIPEIADYAFYVDGVNVVSNISTVILNGADATQITLDFTKLDRSLNSDICYIRLRGYKECYDYQQVQLFFLHRATGFVKTVSNNFWPAWLNKIIDKLDSIFTGTDQDQAGADSFNDSISDQANELQDLTADLNSVTRPELSDVNISTDGLVDSSVVLLATNGLGSILGNDIIIRVLTLALTFALAGFILYGKR